MRKDDGVNELTHFLVWPLPGGERRGGILNSSKTKPRKKHVLRI